MRSEILRKRKKIFSIFEKFTNFMILASKYGRIIVERFQIDDGSA